MSNDWLDLIGAVLGLVFGGFLLILVILAVFGIPLGVLAAGIALLISVL